MINTDSRARQSRNQTPEYLAQRRKGRKEEGTHHEGTKVTKFKRIISEPFRALRASVVIMLF